MEARNFWKEIIGFEPDTLADIGKKLSIPAATGGVLVANIIAQFLNPLVLASCAFVLFMLVLDVSTGFVYNVYIKEPPDRFDKKKIFVSVFQFLLLIGLIVAMVFFKIAMLMAENTPIAWLVPTLDGGITGIFLTMLFLIFLVLLYDFVERSGEMGMPGAATLMLWLKGLINRTAKTPTDEQ